MYWVTPRHLAGDDGDLAERMGNALAGLGWRMWPTSRNTLLYVSPDELRGAEWILAASPFALGGLPVAWQLSARPHAASAMTEWNAYFTAGVPHEALADLLVAIDARETPDVGFEGPERVLTALSAQGWLRDADRPRTTATYPGFSCTVSLELLPPLVQDADPHPDLVGWQAWAEPDLGASYLWCASLSASVPHDLVAAFASSLASPVQCPAAACPSAPRGGSASSTAADDPCPHGAAVAWLLAGLPRVLVLCTRQTREMELCMFFRRRARANREFRKAQQEGFALLQRLAQEPSPIDAAQAEVPAAPAKSDAEAITPDFPPADLRAPSRRDVDGFMMRWVQPLVIDGEVRTCPQCGVYRDWIVFCMHDDSVWLRCRAGHEVRESGLDAAWYNRNSGPVDRYHPTLEEGLRHLGH